MIPPCRKQRQVMADGGLALAELGAQGAHVALALGEDQDDLKPGGVADVLEQNRCAPGLLKPLLGAAEGLGLARGRFRSCGSS